MDADGPLLAGAPTRSGERAKPQRMAAGNLTGFILQSVHVRFLISTFCARYVAIGVSKSAITHRHDEPAGESPHGLELAVLVRDHGGPKSRTVMGGEQATLQFH